MAERLNLAPASVSTAIRNLETHLGVRLMTRTTRKVSLTDDGRAYLARCRLLLAGIEETESALKQTQSRPQGRLRVEIPTGLGHLYVTPALPGFSARYPEVKVVVTLGDRFVDLTEEEVDVILRVGPLEDSTMVAKRVYDARFVTCASPEYVARHGRPKSPTELGQHNCLGYFSASLGRSARWNYRKGGRDVVHAPEGALHMNNSEALIDLAVAGAGIVCMLETGVLRAIRAGHLVPLLDDWESPVLPISVLYWPSRHLSAKVRVFVDFISELFVKQVPHLKPAYGRGG